MAASVVSVLLTHKGPLRSIEDAPQSPLLELPRLVMVVTWWSILQEKPAPQTCDPAAAGRTA